MAEKCVAVPLGSIILWQLCVTLYLQACARLVMSYVVTYIRVATTFILVMHKPQLSHKLMLLLGRV